MLRASDSCMKSVPALLNMVPNWYDSGNGNAPTLVTPGPTNFYCYQMPNGNNPWMKTNFYGGPVKMLTCIQGVRFKLNALSTGAGFTLFNFRDTTQNQGSTPYTTQVEVRVGRNSTNSVEVYTRHNQTQATELILSSLTGAFHYMTVLATADPVNGIITAYMDGILLFTLTGQNTAYSGNNWTNCVTLGDSSQSSVTPLVADFVVCDSVTSTGLTLAFTAAVGGVAKVVRSAGSWVNDGVTPGMFLTFGGSGINVANDGPYQVSAISTTTNPNDTLSLLDPGNAVVTQSGVTSGTATGSYNNAIWMDARVYKDQPSSDVSTQWSRVTTGVPATGTVSGGIVTVTTVGGVGHGLNLSDVGVTQVTISGMGGTNYNGTFTVLALINDTQFTVTNGSASGDRHRRHVHQGNDAQLPGRHRWLRRR